MAETNEIAGVVQRNCHIADARHAGNLTLCTYLLEMREYCRWEQGLPLTASLPKEQVGPWLVERETLWAQVEDDDFGPLPLRDGAVEPFEAATANERLVPLGLVYGAGIGRFHAPEFFLADLVRSERRGGLQVLVAGRELARGIAAAPVTFRDGTITLRQDALRRWLWERVETWSARRHEGPMLSLLQCYEFDHDPEHALSRMTLGEGETLILHEMGEGLAESALGPAWPQMLGALSERLPEALLRAVRDNLADCLHTLPALLEREAPCSIHFYFATFEGMRRALFPALVEGYREWRASGSDAALVQAVGSGRTHWQDVAQSLLDLHASRGEAALHRLAADELQRIAL